MSAAFFLPDAQKSWLCGKRAFGLCPPPKACFTTTNRALPHLFATPEGCRAKAFRAGPACWVLPGRGLPRRGLPRLAGPAVPGVLPSARLSPKAARPFRPGQNRFCKSLLFPQSIQKSSGAKAEKQGTCTGHPGISAARQNRPGLQQKGTVPER